MTESLDSWRKYVAFHGVDHDALSAQEATGMFIEWYRTTPASDVVVDGMGDALILQYGCWSWNDPRSFEYSITRQMIVEYEEDDDAIWQLGLALHFERSAKTEALAKGASEWCWSLEGLNELVEFVEQCDATMFARQHTPFRVTLTLECAG